MNINSFDFQVPLLGWEGKEVWLGDKRMFFLFPYTPRGKYGDPDWRDATMINFGWSNDRIKPMEPGHNVWWGAIVLPESKAKRTKRHLPLILEFPDKEIQIGNTTKFLVATPPGRPGNPMTILVDRDGEIVPDLYFPVCSQIKVLPIMHNWDTFGWTLLYPAIALQFTDGECRRSKLAIAKWQGYLNRNKA